MEANHPNSDTFSPPKLRAKLRNFRTEWVSGGLKWKEPVFSLLAQVNISVYNVVGVHNISCAFGARKINTAKAVNSNDKL